MPGTDAACAMRARWFRTTRARALVSICALVSNDTRARVGFDLVAGTLPKELGNLKALTYLGLAHLSSTAHQEI